MVRGKIRPNAFIPHQSGAGFIPTLNGGAFCGVRGKHGKTGIQKRKIKINRKWRGDKLYKETKKTGIDLDIRISDLKVYL